MGKVSVKRDVADIDPLTLLSAPPRDETPEARAARERAETEAKRVSDAIDEQLRQERAARSKKRAPVKVLLLGQSESGKSTVVKNFQIAYAQNAWEEQRASWRFVVLLNLVRSVNIILDQLARELARARDVAQQQQQHLSLRLAVSASSGTDGDGSDSESDVRSTSNSASGFASSSKLRSKPRHSEKPLKWADHHALLALRLGPLRRVQTDLEARLCAHDDGDGGGPGPATPFVELEAAGAFGRRRSIARPREFFVRSRAGWKGALGWAMAAAGKRRRGRDVEVEVDESLEVILGCKEDIIALWEDPTVRAMLLRYEMGLEDAPGFFLDDVERIVARDYEPSDADVVRARLRTLGVQEYPFVFEKGPQAGREWVMYDVGGARSCRSAWFPYFMDVNAIIFLAPVSVFDEKLDEDPSTNRLEDTYLLWKAVVSSKLLQKVQLVLFLNKCDILQRKLDRGVSITRYVPTYGDRENDMPTAAKYFRKQFRDMMKKHSPSQRPFYCYLTTAIDTKATTNTLATVREILMRDHLERADLIQPL